MAVTFPACLSEHSFRPLQSTCKALALRNGLQSAQQNPNSSVCLTLTMVCAVRLSYVRTHPFQEGLQEFSEAIKNGRSSMPDKGTFQASCICSRSESKLLSRVRSKHPQMTGNQMYKLIRF